MYQEVLYSEEKNEPRHIKILLAFKVKECKCYVHRLSDLNEVAESNAGKGPWHPQLLHDDT